MVYATQARKSIMALTDFTFIYVTDLEERPSLQIK